MAPALGLLAPERRPQTAFQGKLGNFAPRHGVGWSTRGSGAIKKRDTESDSHRQLRTFPVGCLDCGALGTALLSAAPPGLPRRPWRALFHIGKPPRPPVRTNFLFLGGFCGIIRSFCSALVSCPPWRKFSSRGLIFFGNVAPVLWCFC